MKILKYGLIFTFIFFVFNSCEDQDQSQNEEDVINSIEDQTNTSGIISKTDSLVTGKLVIQPNADEGKDARVKENQPDVNWGDLLDMQAGTWTNQGVWRIIRGFIEFDLSGIPSGANIAEATLYLQNAPETNCNDGKHSQRDGANDGWIKRVVEPWNENTIIWNNQPAVTELNKVAIPASSDPNQDYIIDVTNMLDDIINSKEGNNGIRISLQDESYTYKRLQFATSDYPDEDKHPKLKIVYTE